jgi:hypothetical protein
VGFEKTPENFCYRKISNKENVFNTSEENEKNL